MRIGAALLLAAALTACSRGDDTAADGASPSAGVNAARQEDRVRCALQGAEAFEAVCTRELAEGTDGEVWVIRHPDGGFRRFVLIDTGRRIATADGAEEVIASRQGPDLEVRVARDRYRFPAAPAPVAPESHAAVR